MDAPGEAAREPTVTGYDLDVEHAVTGLVAQVRKPPQGPVTFTFADGIGGDLTWRTTH